MTTAACSPISASAAPGCSKLRRTRGHIGSHRTRCGRKRTRPARSPHVTGKPSQEGRGVNETQILATANATNVVAAWDDAHRYTPAPRHRRRLTLRMLRGLDFADCLDAGCAQPFLLRAIVERYGADGFGCDISDAVIAANRAALPGCEFRVLDLTAETWPGERRFDLVVCSEVLEHLADWRAAVTNLVRMSRKHLLITVPSGPVRRMDRMVGHLQHFAGPELCTALEEEGCAIRQVRYWGFPFHSLYKGLISTMSPA